MRIKTSHESFDLTNELVKRQPSGACTKSEQQRLDIKAKTHGYEMVFDNIIERKTMFCVFCGTRNSIQSETCYLCNINTSLGYITPNLTDSYFTTTNDGLKHRTDINVNGGILRACNKVFYSDLSHPINPKKNNARYPLKTHSVSYKDGILTRVKADPIKMAMLQYDADVQIYKDSKCKCFDYLRKTRRNILKAQNIIRKIKELAKRQMRVDKVYRIIMLEVVGIDNELKNELPKYQQRSLYRQRAKLVKQLNRR